MNEAINDNIFKSYTLDYVGKYHFYEEEEFIEAVKDGEYILKNLKRAIDLIIIKHPILLLSLEI